MAVSAREREIDPDIYLWGCVRDGVRDYLDAL